MSPFHIESCVALLPGVDTQGSYLDVSTPRMYYLLKNKDFSSHLLALEPQHADFVLHSFTYGNDCQQDFEQK